MRLIYTAIVVAFCSILVVSAFLLTEYFFARQQQRRKEGHSQVRRIFQFNSQTNLNKNQRLFSDVHSSNELSSTNQQIQQLPAPSNIVFLGSKGGTL